MRKLRKSRRSVSREISASAPANSTPVGPRSDNHKRKPGPPYRRVRFALGSLERRQNLVAHRRRVFDRLEPWRNLLPLIMPEVVIASARCHNQMRVSHRRLVRQFERRFFASSPTASSSRTKVSRCPRSSDRSGAAISPGDSDPVAT